MVNVGTNSSNILFQIPTPPVSTPSEVLRNNVQEQLPQTNKTSQKKAEAVLPARLDFVHVFEPWAFRENEMPKYSVTLIISKNDKCCQFTFRAFGVPALVALGSFGSFLFPRFSLQRAYLTLYVHNRILLLFFICKMIKSN